MFLCAGKNLDYRGPVRVLGLRIITDFSKRDTDYWTINLNIMDYLCCILKLRIIIGH